MSNTSISLIRSIVDPMILKLRNEIFENSGYSGSIKGALIPSSVILSGVRDGIEQATQSGELLKPYLEFTANESISSGNVLYTNGEGVSIAYPTQIQHAGRIIGIAQNSASQGSIVNVITYGVAEFLNISLQSTGTVFLSQTGFPTDTFYSESVFYQLLGISITPNKMFVDISKLVIIL